ncbi:DUF7511 domain-containing protein [Haladaptatus sp. ZSTT2]|uniref:DUF7511 domain-containing protein n=1 Tax=Haladaptatus sp. ZSTT2 TaxID=3120515 RepID=UPI00300EC335
MTKSQPKENTHAAGEGALLPATGIEFDLQSVLVRYQHAPDELTVFPRDRSEADVYTTWITASEGSYVDLSEMC